MNRSELGKRGEELAARYLIEHGYKIITRNYRCSIGEIDIIAFFKGLIIFVEVRTRATDGFGTPAESITYKKARKIRRVAEYYLTETKGVKGENIRFDFIGIFIGNSSKPEIEHIQGVF